MTKILVLLFTNKFVINYSIYYYLDENGNKVMIGPKN